MSSPSRAVPVRECIPAVRRDRQRRPPPAEPSALALAKDYESAGEIVLCHGPQEWHAFAGAVPQCCTKGGDGLFEPRRGELALAEPPKRKTQIACVVAQSSGARREYIPAVRRDRQRPPLGGALCFLRSPTLQSARRRLFRVIAQRDGARSPVCSSSAAALRKLRLAGN